jgi:hypothetical protein
MLAERGHFQQAEQEWSGHPNAVKLADLDVICVLLGCEVGELLIPEAGPGCPARRRGPVRPGGCNRTAGRGAPPPWLPAAARPRERRRRRCRRGSWALSAPAR